MSDQHISGEVPIILPTPMAVSHIKESRFSVMARFFSWLTACLLAVSVLVALLSVTTERNDLRNQVNTQTKAQVCRAAAGVRVNQAIIDEQIAISKHSVAIGTFVSFVISVSQTDPNYKIQLDAIKTDIDMIDSTLAGIAVQLQDAVDGQQKALLEC